jgi:hypothetical protein
MSFGRGKERKEQKSGMSGKKQRLEPQTDVVLRQGVPLVLILEICKFLTLSDLRRVRSVSTSMRQLLRSFAIERLSMEELEDFGMPLLDTLDLFASKTTWLKCTSMIWKDMESWSTVLTHLPRLRHLHLQLWTDEEVSTDVHAEDLRRILSTKPLVGLDVYQLNPRLPTVFFSHLLEPSRLQRFHLDGLVCFRTEEDAMVFVQALPPCLTDLFVGDILWMTTTTFKQLLHRCPRLTRLDLNLSGDGLSLDSWSLLYTPPRM